MPAGKFDAGRQPAYRLELARHAGAGVFAGVLQLAGLQFMEYRDENGVGEFFGHFIGTGADFRGVAGGVDFG